MTVANSVALRAVVGVGLLGAVLAAGGCQPPRGDSGGRVDVTRTTPAERNDARVNTASLFEFSDQVSQQLAADLSQVPELNGEYRSTIVFGDINNKTGIVSSNDFEAFRMRIRGKLMQSRGVLKNVQFVENKARADDLIRRETGGSGDLLQEGTRQERAALNADYTYFLNGNMYRVERGNSATNTYLMNFELTNMKTGAIIWTNEPYEVKQAR
ncbi:MAG: hypothetical protein U0637_01985 [Phycisphaerales bacterium]